MPRDKTARLTRRRGDHRSMRSRLVVGAAGAALVVAAAITGCGSNASTLVFQAIDASANTALDLVLTQFANQVADAFNPPPAATPTPTPGPTPTPPPGGGNGCDGSGEDPIPEGDAAAGEETYFNTGCNGCHGDNGEGGAGPPLAGQNSFCALQDRFSDGGVHFGTSLTEEEIENVATWLLDL